MSLQIVVKWSRDPPKNWNISSINALWWKINSELQFFALLFLVLFLTISVKYDYENIQITLLAKIISSLWKKKI